MNIELETLEVHFYAKKWKNLHFFYIAEGLQFKAKRETLRPIQAAGLSTEHGFLEAGKPIPVGEIDILPTHFTLSRTVGSAQL